MDQAQMLIIVDMLNDFCKPDGVLYCGDAVPEVIKNRWRTYAKTPAVVIALYQFEVFRQPTGVCLV